MRGDIYGRGISSLLILVVVVFSMIVLCVGGEFFLSLLLWLLDDGFNLSWNEVLHATKVGAYGGGVGGVGIALLHFFQVKGF